MVAVLSVWAGRTGKQLRVEARGQARRDAHQIELVAAVLVEPDRDRVAADAELVGPEEDLRDEGVAGSGLDDVAPRPADAGRRGPLRIDRRLRVDGGGREQGSHREQQPGCATLSRLDVAGIRSFAPRGSLRWRRPLPTASSRACASRIHPSVAHFTGAAGRLADTLPQSSRIGHRIGRFLGPGPQSAHARRGCCRWYRPGRSEHARLPEAPVVPSPRTRSLVPRPAERGQDRFARPGPSSSRPCCPACSPSRSPERPGRSRASPSTTPLPGVTAGDLPGPRLSDRRDPRRRRRQQPVPQLRALRPRERGDRDLRRPRHGRSIHLARDRRRGHVDRRRVAHQRRGAPSS